MNHYAVVHKLNRKKPAAFSGSAKQVLDWLKNQADVKQYEIYQHSPSKYFTISEFLKQVNDFVPKFYEMDSETEDLLPNGKHLANGMVVLIGEPERRHTITGETEDWVLDRLRKDNRWCRVSHLTIKGDCTVSFVATYNDGTKRLREMSIEAPWLVKLDSMGEVSQKYLFVYETVKDVLDVELRRKNEVGRSSIVADEITKKILGAL